ncbi:MAG: response regulator [Hyphomicrobiaceae bacterium]|nr:response regulator [Hyphomicrobiaceae bacterium]
MTAAHVLILTQSEALGSILAATLRADGTLATRQALGLDDAIRVMRALPIRFVICDRVFGGQPMEKLLPILRDAAEFGRFEAILLTHDVDAGLQDACRQSGVDEVIIKPMSPRFIAERLSARIGRHDTLPDSAVSFGVLAGRHNVVPFLRRAEGRAGH